MVGFNPERGIKRRKEKEGIRRPETIGPEGERGITIEIKLGRVKITTTFPPEAFKKDRQELVVRTPEGVVRVEVELPKEFLEEFERSRKITKEIREALKETPGIPEEVKKIFEDVKAHLPEELPEILQKLKENLKQVVSEEQRRGLENTIKYLTRLQKIAEQIEEETVPSNIIERLRRDEGFGQVIKEIAELFSTLKKDIDTGLELIFPDKEKRENFLDKVRRGRISSIHAINLITGEILRNFGKKGIRVDEGLLEYWIKPLVTGIARYIIDQLLKDYKEKLLQELENLEQQFLQAGRDYQKLRELLRNLYERIEGENRNKLLEGLKIQEIEGKDEFNTFLEVLLKNKNKKLALSKIRLLVIKALKIRVPEEIFKEVDERVKKIAELVYDKLIRNFPTQQTETASGSVIGNMGEAILTKVNELLSTIESSENLEKMSKKKLRDTLGTLFIILSEEEMNKFGSNLEELTNKLKTLSEKSEEEALRLLNEFFSAIERKTGKRPSDEAVKKIYEILLASK